jgi:peptidoglycan/xylan/chitin deacetylase (PgdA/CDA1 family)
VLLTFDDGPSEYLSAILSILKAENVQAGFFWQTNRFGVEKSWQRVLSGGHVIGTHSHSHQKLPDLPYDQQYREIQTSKEVLESAIGKTINWFRPPYGLYSEDTMKAAEKLDLDVVLWQVASWDWKHEEDEEMILENVLGHVSAGDIVLLHELPQTVRILPSLIKALREKGFKLSVPHSEINLSSHL